MQEKTFYCVFTHEGEVMGSIEEKTDEEIRSYNSVWGINSFNTFEDAEAFAADYSGGSYLPW